MDAEMQKMLALMNGLSGRSMNEWAESVERAGQAEMVHSERLPKDTGFGKSDLEPYKAIGIQFGDEVDDLFIEATLPVGWNKVRTDHYMWSKVVDENGRERISIFYKPEFYDRKAHMSLCVRYGIGSHYSDDGNSRTVYIRDGETEIHTIGTASKNGDDRYAYYDACDRLEKQAHAWLAEHYPDWRNPLAYWEEATSDAG